MKNRFSKLIEKDGFYIILFICVCIVAITAVLTSKKNLNKTNEDNLSKIEDFTIVDEEKDEPSLEIARMEKELVMEDEEMEDEEIEDEVDDEAKEEEEDLELVESVIEDEHISTKVTEEMMAPVDGKLGATFTTDNLIYSETLEEWTSHKGIDILANEGTDVRATLSGKITEVYKDDLWGIVILIDHGDGLMTKYANLSTEEMIKEGAKVNRGDVISKVGKSASIELMMEPHIHFEVIKDGISVDPRNYIPVLK